jgi:hypothetical protein
VLLLLLAMLQLLKLVREVCDSLCHARQLALQSRRRCGACSLPIDKQCESQCVSIRLCVRQIACDAWWATAAGVPFTCNSRFRVNK